MLQEGGLAHAGLSLLSWTVIWVGRRVGSGAAAKGARGDRLGQEGDRGREDGRAYLQHQRQCLEGGFGTTNHRPTTTEADSFHIGNVILPSRLEAGDQ